MGQPPRRSSRTSSRVAVNADRWNPEFSASMWRVSWNTSARHAATSEPKYPTPSSRIAGSSIHGSNRADRSGPKRRSSFHSSGRSPRVLCNRHKTEQPVHVCGSMSRILSRSGAGRFTTSEGVGLFVGKSDDLTRIAPCNEPFTDAERLVPRLVIDSGIEEERLEVERSELVRQCVEHLSQSRDPFPLLELPCGKPALLTAPFGTERVQRPFGDAVSDAARGDAEKVGYFAGRQRLVVVDKLGQGGCQACILKFLRVGPGAAVQVEEGCLLYTSP